METLKQAWESHLSDVMINERGVINLGQCQFRFYVGAFAGLKLAKNSGVPNLETLLQEAIETIREIQRSGILNRRP